MNHTWALAFTDDRGLSGSLRLTTSGTDDGASASFHAQVVVPEVGVVVVRDDEIVPPKQHDLLVVRAEGLWAELLCETPNEHWSFGLEAFGVRFDDEAEAATSDRGDRVAVGFDLEWETPDRVVGEVLVGRTRHQLDARGTFQTPSFGVSRDEESLPHDAGTHQLGEQRVLGGGRVPSTR